MKKRHTKTPHGGDKISISNRRVIKPLTGAKVHLPGTAGKATAAPTTSSWTDIIPAGQWASYRMAIEAARNAGIRFLLGGGFALAVYAGRWRNTKDIDFYIMPRDREAMIATLSNIGFVDYYDQKPYDTGWIYRSTRDHIIVDVIWSMANRRAEVDELWFEYAPTIVLKEETLFLVPVEELLWCKLYIMQRDHCDWTDAFNLIHTNVTKIDWERLLHRLGDDWPLLAAALTIYSWICPGNAANLPAWLRRKLHLPPAEPDGPHCIEERIKQLDSRAWFAPFQPADRFLEI